MVMKTCSPFLMAGMTTDSNISWCFLEVPPMMSPAASKPPAVSRQPSVWVSSWPEWIRMPVNPGTAMISGITRPYLGLQVSLIS